MADKHVTDAKLVARHEFGGGLYGLTLDAPDIARGAAPGRFVTVRGWEGTAPLINRPLSLAGAARGRIELLVREVGAGTALLRRRRVGDTLQVIGPLGNAFPEPGPAGETWLVAGGIGLAPFLFYARRHARAKTRLFFGCCSGDETCALAPLPARILCHVTTEDGAVGVHGLVTDALTDVLRRVRPARILTCGPWPMMRAVAALADSHSVPCVVSLETYMSCGFGACMGCAVPRPGGAGFFHACKDGPVFDARDIDWKAHP